MKLTFMNKRINYPTPHHQHSSFSCDANWLLGSKKQCAIETRIFQQTSLKQKCLQNLFGKRLARFSVKPLEHCSVIVQIKQKNQVLWQHEAFTNDDGQIHFKLSNLSPGKYSVDFLAPEKTCYQRVGTMPLHILKEHQRFFTFDLDETLIHTELSLHSLTRTGAQIPFIESMPKVVKAMNKHHVTAITSASSQRMDQDILEAVKIHNLEFTGGISLRRWAQDWRRLKNPTVYKVTAILKKLALLPPHSPLVFLGDNKEKDTVVYSLVQAIVEQKFTDKKLLQHLQQHGFKPREQQRILHLAHKMAKLNHHVDGIYIRCTATGKSEEELRQINPQIQFFNNGKDLLQHLKQKNLLT